MKVKKGRKGWKIINGELIDLEVYKLQVALKEILEVCDGHVGYGPFNVITEIANSALEET